MVGPCFFFQSFLSRQSFNPPFLLLLPLIPDQLHPFPQGVIIANGDQSDRYPLSMPPPALHSFDDRFVMIGPSYSSLRRRVSRSGITDHRVFFVLSSPADARRRLNLFSCCFHSIVILTGTINWQLSCCSDLYLEISFSFFFFFQM